MLNRDITPAYILQVVRRRKLPIILLTTVVTTIAVIYALMLPNIYLSDTVILVEPQQSIETNSGKPSIGMAINRDSLATISQQILSRSHLEQIIDQYSLYNSLPMEQRVRNMRNDTQLDIVRPDAGNVSGFKLSYQHQDPKVAADVTNLLAVLFIEENVSSRNDILSNRLQFLKDQLTRTKVDFDDQEKQLEVFKQKNFEKLPEQREKNLKMIEQVNIQLANNNEALNRVQQQRVYLESMASQYQSAPKPVRTPLIVSDLAKTEPTIPEITLSPVIKTQFDEQNERLAELQNKYTDKHPDVINASKRVAELKQQYLAQLDRIAELKQEYKARLEQDVINSSKRVGEAKEALEAKKEQGQPNTANGLLNNQSRDKAQENSNTMSPEIFATLAQVTSQLNSIKPEIQDRISERNRLMYQLKLYQSYLQVSPEVEQEFAKLNRDYSSAKENYQAILNERDNTQLAQELENKQKTKLFRVLDPAKISEKPYKPNRRAIALYGLLAGLGMGFGLAFYREFDDSALHTEKDVETTLGFEVLATIPKI